MEKSGENPQETIQEKTKITKREDVKTLINDLFEKYSYDEIHEIILAVSRRATYQKKKDKGFWADYYEQHRDVILTRSKNRNKQIKLQKT